MSPDRQIDVPAPDLGGIDPGRRALLRGAFGLAAGAALGTTLLACSDDDGAAAPQTSDDTAGPDQDDTPTADLDLPVNDEDALRAQFDPRYEPLGLRVTRIGLYDLDAGFVPDDQGTHLAIYVEPIVDADWDIARYIDTLAPSTAVSAPFVFEEWADLESFDVCQEPPQSESPEPQPPVMTQVVMDRADVEAIDWDTVTLAHLLAAQRRSPDTARIAGRPDVVDTDMWQQASVASADL